MTTQTLSFGTSVTASQEKLQICSLDEVFQRITGAVSSTLEYDTARLRKLQSLDKVGYRAAKTRLPYVVGSIFHEGVRRIEALSGAHYFILDVDHIELENGKIPSLVLREPSVALAFVSPGGEGVKIFCRLHDPCTDPKRFSAVYKTFASAFADRIGLSGSMDLRTSDVSRACFLSFDSNAFYNANSLEVDWQTLENIGELNEGDRPQRNGEAESAGTGGEINERAYKDILKAINPNTPVRREKDVFVPPLLIDFQREIPELCKKANLEITKMEPINYGLKIAAAQGYRSAEVNVFYGKKGFSVIISPRTGTDPALNDLLYGCIYQHLFPPIKQIDISLTEYFSTN